jgi:hypothetical protein
VITKRHLAVLRAALQYFDEEMSPHGQHVMRHYFDEPIGEELTTREIQELRDFLRGCDLRYACCDQAATRVIRSELSITIEEACAVIDGQLGQIAAVLLQPGR